MKSISRITAVATLLAPALLGGWMFSSGDRPVAYPPQPVTRATLTQRGLLTVAIPPSAWPSLLHRPDTNDFDYDLLDCFASNLGIGLATANAESETDAVRQLEYGQSELAVLPGSTVPPDGMVRARPCDCGAGGQTDAHVETGATLALFVRRENAELLGLIQGVVPRLTRMYGGEGLFEHYCFERSFAHADAEVEPVARKIAHYAKAMAQSSREVGLDWKLVAAVIYEESGFQSHAVSTSGARGLMQIMPWIPAEVGIANVAAPEANIRAGVRYLGRLSEMFPNAVGRDRWAIALAAYLLGPGHVFDAQDLARQRGLKPYVWQGGLENVLPLLEDERYFAHARSGFARGQHAVGYVNRILERYELYKRQIGLPEEQTASIGGRSGSA